jgi:hypothetical protein
MVPTKHLADLIEPMQTQPALPSPSHQHHLHQQQMHQHHNPTLMLLTSPNENHMSSNMLNNHLINHPDSNTSANSMQQLTSMNSAGSGLATSTPSHLINNNNGVDANNNSTNSMNNHRINKELQFLQSAINEADLSDLYQTLTNASTSSNEMNTSASSSNNSISVNNNIHAAKNSYGSFQPGANSDHGDMSMIVQMQGELIDQHKELRSIEHQTMEQLRVLQMNLNRLARRFDSFECTVLNHVSRATRNLQPQQQPVEQRDARNNFNKMNNSMQQIKVNRSLIICSSEMILLVKFFFFLR